MVLARRQHLVACIRPPERVHVPFPWHTAPYPPSSASLHLFRVLSARVPFQDCSRVREYLYQYLVATRLVYTYVKESNDSKKKKNRRLLFHRGTTRITYHIAVYFPLFSPPKRWWKETRLEAVFQHAVDGRRNVLEQRFVTGFLVAAVEILAQPSVQSAVEDYIPGQVIPQRCWTSIFYSQRLVTLRFVPV